MLQKNQTTVVMKRIITLLLISMTFFSLLAEERNIELHRKAHGTEPRSLTYIPTVTHDDNILYIYSDISLENLQVTITDLSTGTIFHFNDINVFYSQPYILHLNYIGSGNFKIEIDLKGTRYYGYFELVSK